MPKWLPGATSVQSCFSITLQTVRRHRDPILSLNARAMLPGAGNENLSLHHPHNETP